MPYFVDKRAADAGPDHPFARYADDRDRIFAAARQARSRPPDRRADPPLQPADQGDGIVRRTRHSQGVGGEHVETIEPGSEVVLAALRQDVRKDVEMRQQLLKLQAQDNKASLRLIVRRRSAGRAGQPVVKTVDEAIEACLGSGDCSFV